MASHRSRSRGPTGTKRSAVESPEPSRRRDRSLSPHHYHRRHLGERGASPARASRREEGPGRAEAQPHYRERQRQPPHNTRTPPRRRSRSRRRRRSRSRSIALSPRPPSSLSESPPPRPRPLDTARLAHTPSSRPHRASPAVDRTHSRRVESFTRGTSPPRGGSRDFTRWPAGGRPRDESSHRRQASSQRPTSSRASPEPHIAPAHQYRSSLFNSNRHGHQRRSNDFSASDHELPSRKIIEAGREREHKNRQIDTHGGDRVRTPPSDPHSERHNVAQPQLKRARSSSPGTRLIKTGKGSSPELERARNLGSATRDEQSPPAFKIRGKAKLEIPPRPRTGDTEQAESPEESVAEGVADGDNMYNAQWQGGRGGPGQRQPSFGYQQNRGGWQGYQGSPPHGYSPQQQSQFQQYPNAGPQTGYNQQQYGGSPPTNYQHQNSYGPRGGAAMGRGQPPFGGRGGFRGAHQQSPPVHRGAHSAGGPPTRGAPHFSNLSWTPQTGSRGGHAPIDKQNSIPAPNLPPTMDKQPETQPADAAEDDDDDNPFRPSKDLRVEDQSAKKEKEKLKALGEAQQTQQSEGRANMAPPDKPVSATAADSTGPKFSFSLKASKAEAQAPAAPKPDLLQKAPLAGPPAQTPSHAPYREKRFDQSPPTSGTREYRDDHRAPIRTRREPWDDRREDDRSGSSDFRPTGFSLEYKTDRPPPHAAFVETDRGARGPGPAPRDVRAGDKRLSGGDVPMHDAPRPPPEVKKKYRKVMVRKLKEKPIVPEQWKKSASIYYRDETQDIVGSGTYGKVYKAVNAYTKEVVALKRIRMEGEKDGYPTTAVREIRILQAGSKSSNIVSFLEIMIENNECYMVFEYVEHDLTGLLNNPEFTLSAAHKKDLCRQLFAGIHFCHQNSILHRDIKAANILVTGTGVLKIADFGLARIYDKKAVRDEDPKKRPPYTNRVVTIWYRSPELCLGEVYYSTSVDVWSCACVMMEVYTRGAIFPGDGTEMNQYHKIASILGKPTPEVWPALRDMEWYTVFWPAKNTPRVFEDKYADKMSAGCLALLSSVFQWDPDRRPSAADVLEHPFFTEEEPAPRQAVELAELKGDWHEYESKKLRKEKEKEEREERHRVRAEEANRQQQQQQQSAAAQEAEDAGKRKAGSPVDVEVEVKKPREEVEA